MKAEEIERFLRRRRVPRFDGVFSIDTPPDRPCAIPILRMDPADIGSAYASNADAENFSTLSVDDPTNLSNDI